MMYIAKPTQTSTHAPSEALFIEADDMHEADRAARKLFGEDVSYSVQVASEHQAGLAQGMCWTKYAKDVLK